MVSHHNLHHMRNTCQQKGIICFLADYRVKERNNTTPFEALMDAKSAIRYIKNMPSIITLTQLKSLLQVLLRVGN